MRSLPVAAVPAAVRRLGAVGIAFDPGVHVVVIKLLGPEHAGKRLPHDGFRILRKFRGNARGVKLFGFLLARREEAVEASGKVVRGGGPCRPGGARGAGGRAWVCGGCRALPPRGRGGATPGVRGG